MAPKKRTSGGAPQGKSKAARTSKGGANQALPVPLPPHAVMMPHIKMFDDWMNESVLTHNLTMDKFLERALLPEVKQKEFFAFIEAEFPADSSQPFSSAYDLGKDGTSLALRPWQCPYRADYGLRGTSDTDTQHSLAQLILLNGFLTDPNTPGVEKIVACPMQHSWLAAPVTGVRATDFGSASEMMDPGNVFLVKGWNRCVSMLTVLFACFDRPELVKELPDDVRKSFGTVHATAVQPDGNNVVNTNRGVTLAGNLRRRPNAFNILHQLEFLERTGLSQDLSIRALEAHESVSKFASAYSLGDKESKAAVNLLQHIPKMVKEGLIELVRQHGQPKFVTHEALADNLMNLNHSTASGFLLPWKDALTNSEPLVELMLLRMEKDFLALAPRMRKAWNSKDLAQLQRVCGAFLACVDQFQTQVPQKFASTALVEINKSFEMRHGDADLLQLLEESVPPVDITRVAIFSQPLAKYQQEVAQTNDARAQQLSAQLLQTTWEQCQLQVEGDLRKLADWSVKHQLFAGKQAALDFKYLNDRYQKGRVAIQAHMDEKMTFHRCSSLVLAHSHIVEAQSKMGSDGLTILVGDCTLWPTRVLSIDESVTLCQSISSGNANTVSFWMLPQWHASMAKTTILKNRRLLEDKIVGVLDIYEIAVNFSDVQHQGDKRKRSQQCLAGVSGHSTVAFSKSKALMGTIANVPRARVQDLSNPDPDKPLSPPFRAQQRGVAATKFLLEQILDGMHTTSKHPVLIVDLMPTRFSEWSLLGTDGADAWDVRCMSLYHESDSFLDSHKSLLTGRMMDQWWDKCQEAGPSARTVEPFNEDLPELDCLTVSESEVKIPEMVVNKYQASHTEPLKALQDKISQDTTIQTAIKTRTMSSAAAGSGGVTRTLATPDWDGNPPWNWRKSLPLSSISVADFDTANTLEGCSTLARDPDLEVVVTSLNSVWVINRGTSAKDLGAGELFGFNTGSFLEVPSDQCATQAGNVPWFVSDDRMLVCDITSGSKTLSTLADVLCEVTKSRGVTEVRVIDHALQPKTKVAADGGQVPLAYRFKVTPGAKVNAFKPKDITEDKMTLRSAMFGALWNGRMAQLPRCSHADVVWEVKIGEGVPCTVTPVKPKFYLLGNLSIGAASAVKIK